MSALGSLIVKLGLDYAQFTSGLDKSEQEALAHAKRVQETLDGIKGKVVGVAGAIAGGLAAAFTIGAFKSLISDSVAAGAALDDLSMQTGATAEALSGLAEVGKFNSLSAQAIGAAMNVLTRNLAGTTEESKGAGAALKALGLNMEEFRQLKPEDQMQVLAKSLDGVQDGAGKSAVMMALYGKQGAEMLPFMKDLATVGELQARITTDQAAAAARLDDNWTKLTTTTSDMARDMATGMVPALDEAVRVLMELVSGGNGLRETMHALVADGSIERWTKTAITGLGYVVLAGVNVSYVLSGIGREIGGIVAQFSAMGEAGGIFTQAGRNAWTAVGEALREDGERARKELDDLQEKILSAGAASSAATDKASESAKKSAIDFRNVGSSASKASSELEKLVKAGVELTQSLKVQDGGLSSDFTKKWDSLSAAYAAGAIGLDALLDAQRVLLSQQPAMEREVKALEEAQKAEAHATAEASKAYITHMASLDASTAKLQEQVTARADDIARMGLSKQAIAELDAARLEEQATILDGIAIKRMDRNLDEAEYNALKEQARLKRDLARLAREGAAKEAAQDLEKENQKAAKDAEEAWKRASEKIESSITDALMRGFESGKGFAENLRDTVVNMFKTLVLRPVVEFGVRGGLSVLGMGGMAGPASAADMMGGMGNLGSLGSGMSTLSGLGSWFTDFGGSVTASIDKIGRSVADLSEISGSYGATVDSIGTSIQSSASAIGQAASYVGYAMAAVSAIDAANKGQWGKAIGTGVGAYFGGPIGAAIGGAVGGWVDDAFGGGHEYTTGTGISGRFSGKQFAGRNYQDWRNDGSSGLFGIGASGSSSGTNYSAMDAAAQKGLGSAYGKLLDQTAQFTKALGGNADAILGYQKDIKLALGSDVEANKQAIAAMFKGIANEVASTVVDAQYIRDGEGAADTLARLATNLTVVNDSLDMLDANLLSVGQASGDAASSLVDSFGGLQQYQSAIGTYYLRFYSQEERLAKTREQLNKQFGDLGLSVPSTIEAYRNLVNAQDLSTEAGRKNYEALISMSSAFADITDAAAAAQVKLTDVAKTLDSMVKDIASARTSVASARNQVSPAPVMGLDAIRAGVLAATTSADTSAMMAAGNVLGQKTLADTIANDAYKVASANATAASQSYASLQDANTAYVNQIKAAGTEIHDIANSYGTHGLGIKLSTIWAPYSTGLNNDAYRYNSATNRVNAFVGYGGDKWTDTQSLLQGGKSTTYYANTAGMLADPRFQQLNAMLGNANSQLQYFENRIAFSKLVLDASNKNLATATSNKAAADLEAQKAAQDYAKAVNDWTAEASKSVPALEKLRDETMRYYESQKALAEGMANGAANLRSAVAGLRATQLDPRAAAQQQLREFDKNYTLALSTQGFEKAAYADKLAAALPALSDAIKATSSNADWVATMARLSAQSSAIADQLDASAPKNYQAESLSLLDNIDSALGVLDDSTRAITRAIDASGSVTAQGLRAVVVALGGTPAFASGGYHSGGLRLVGENGPELEVTGPSRIFSAAQTRNILAGGGSTERLEALVEKQAQQLEALRAELRAIAAHTANTAENTRSMDRHGVMVWTDPAAPIDTKVAA